MTRAASPRRIGRRTGLCVCALSHERKLYLSGPMSGVVNLNFPLFHAEAERLRALGFVVCNPAEINTDTTLSWSDCLRADIAQLVTCNAIAVLPGWTKSRGANLEVHIAKALGMPVLVASELTRPMRDYAA